MKTMRAVVASDGKPTIVEDYPVPPMTAECVRIAVRATALNRADLMQVRGQYPPPAGAPHTLGLELAGEIVEVGAKVSGWEVGQRVMALVAGGGYAEQAVVHHEHIMPIPDGLSYEQAAAIPEAFLTAYSNMIEIGRLCDNERVLIHAGASGVGLAAIQLASISGAEVYTTASAAKHAICRENGADVTIDYRTQNFADVIRETCGGVHLVIDFIGAPYWDDNVRVLEKWGRLVLVGLMGGTEKTINLRDIMAKRLSIMGSTLRNREHGLKSALIRNFSGWGLPLFANDDLKANVWRVMALDEVRAAHALMRENKNAGKIVLTL